MSEGSQSKQETQASDSQRGVYDRNLLLLVPELVYSTGNVFEHWQLDPRVPERDKEELASRKTVQSFLARFMKSRSESALKILASDDEQARKFEKATQPITTLEYGGKKSGMKLYLGAQYSFFAARYLGDEPAFNVDELLELIEKNKDCGISFNETLLEGHLRSIATQAQGPDPLEEKSHYREQEQPCMDSVCSDHVLSPPQNFTNSVSLEMAPSSFPASDLPRLPTRLLRIATLALVCIFAGFAFGKYWYEKSEEEILDAYLEEWEKHGPREISKDATEAKPETSAEIFIALWEKAIDIDSTIESVEILSEQLLSAPEPHYQAKAKYTLGVAYLERGNAFLAADYFQEASDILIKLPDEKSVLYNTYIYLAQCRFYTYETKDMLTNLQLASDISAVENESKLMLIWGWYWIRKGSLEQAEKSLSESLRLSLLEGNATYTGFSHANFALIKISQGELSEAFQQINLAESLATKHNNGSLFDLVYATKLYWSERMDLPIDAIEQRLKETKNPMNGKYINTLINSIREHEK